jgi:hypothetical protein
MRRAGTRHDNALDERHRAGQDHYHTWGHMRKRLMRFLVLALVGAAGKALRKKIQQRNQAAEDDRRMAHVPLGGH